jgi:hypothetical protein
MSASSVDNNVVVDPITTDSEPSDADVLKAAIKIVRDAGFDVVVKTAVKTGSRSVTEWVSHADVRSFFATLKVGDRVLSKTEIAQILGKSVSLISTVTADSEDGLNRHWSRQAFEGHKTVLETAVSEMNRLEALLN